MLVRLQFKAVLEALIEGLGLVKSSVILMEVEASHPLTPVTVNTYVLAEVTVRDEEVPTTLTPSNQE
jgi:hypothetical protein